MEYQQKWSEAVERVKNLSSDYKSVSDGYFRNQPDLIVKSRATDKHGGQGWVYTITLKELDPTLRLYLTIAKRDTLQEPDWVKYILEDYEGGKIYMREIFKSVMSTSERDLLT